MKLSNKILIGLFGTVFIYLTAAFTEIRFRGEPHIIDDSNSLVEAIEISELGYLILPDLDQRIIVLGSGNPRIEVRSHSGDLLKNLKYKVSGDTLEILSLVKEEKQRISISIHVPNQKLRGITSNGANIIVENLHQDTLSITQSSGWIQIQKKSILSNLNINVINDGNFNLSDSELNTLSATIDNSEVIIMPAVDRLEGTMTNESYLLVNVIEDLQFKKDKSSRLVMN